MAIADIVGRGLGCSAAADGFIVTLGFGPVWSSVYGRVLLATQQSIQSLGLDGIDASSVVVQKLPVDRHLGIADGVALPAILITPEGETIDPASGTNLMDDVTYAVRVTLVDRDNQEPTLVANVDRYFCGVNESPGLSQSAAGRRARRSIPPPWTRRIVDPRLGKQLVRLGVDLTVRQPRAADRCLIAR